MKKAISMILALVLCASFAACGSAKQAEQTTLAAETTQAAQPTETEAAAETAPALSGKVTVYMPRRVGRQVGGGLHGEDRRRGRAVPGYHR